MNSKKKFKFIYGPVASWRLGSSLGIDVINEDKICTFDCIYCQLGKTIIYPQERKVWVSTNKVIEEVCSLPPFKIDYITFSGMGEPTAAKNLGETIEAIKKVRKEPIAVLTNSSLMDREEVRGELSLADFVMVKLDASSQESLEKVNRPMEGITLDAILQGIKKFRREYDGKLGLQIMFMKENKKKAEELAFLAGEIRPDEIQINTPLRPCNVDPLPKDELLEIKQHFGKMKVVSVYEEKMKRISSINTEDTVRRRGKPC